MCDWHGAETNAEGKLTEAAKDKVQNRVDEIIAEVPRENIVIKGSLTQKYKASKEYCRAMDEVFQDTPNVGGLAHFKSDCRPLKFTEKRYETPFEKLPLHVQLLSPGRKHRNCIIDTATGETRLEVPSESIAPPLDQVRLQMGAGPQLNHLIHPTIIHYNLYFINFWIHLFIYFHLSTNEWIDALGP